MKFVAAAVVAASLIVGGTAGFAKARENVELRVPTAGVDFADAGSVAKFRAKVAKEIAEQCNPGDRINADLSPDFKCRKSMQQVSEVRIAQLATTANSRMAIVD
jgi:UrcA family protein